MATDTSIDSARLLREQYKDGSNLSARIRLHQRFSTNRYGQMRWMFDRIQLPENARVLEVGCGTGLLWRGRPQVPGGWRVILTDMSDGMLRETRASLAQLGHSFSYMQADAQAIPFRDESFDAVIANHMLYHVPDIPRALGEVRRVLKPSGVCYAATMGLREHERDGRTCGALLLDSANDGIDRAFRPRERRGLHAGRVQ